MNADGVRHGIFPLHHTLFHIHERGKSSSSSFTRGILRTRQNTDKMSPFNHLPVSWHTSSCLTPSRWTSWFICRRVWRSAPLWQHIWPRVCSNCSKMFPEYWWQFTAHTFNSTLSSTIHLCFCYHRLWKKGYFEMRVGHPRRRCCFLHFEFRLQEY